MLHTARQLSNQRYSVCIRPPAEYCSITWSLQPNAGNYAFSISEAADQITPDQAGGFIAFIYKFLIIRSSSAPTSQDLHAMYFTK